MTRLDVSRAPRGHLVRHQRLVIPHQEPLRPAPALLALEPPPDVLEQYVPTPPVRQRLVVQRNAAVARLTERAEGERLVTSQGAEDEASSAATLAACGLTQRALEVRPEKRPVKTLTA